MKYIIHHAPRRPRTLRSGLPTSLQAAKALGTAGRWLGALALALLIGVAGRVEMDDALVAEDMRAELAAAAAVVAAPSLPKGTTAVTAEPSRCKHPPLAAQRVTPPNDNSRARCVRLESEGPL